MIFLTPLTWCFLFFALFGLVYTVLTLTEYALRAFRGWCIRQVIHWRWRQYRRSRRYPNKVIRT